MDRCLKDASQHLLCNATQEGIDRMLPAEFVTLQSPITQGGPEPAFRSGGIAAKFRCPLSHGGASKPSPASLRSAPSPAVRARGYKTTYPSSESCAAAAYVPIDPACPSPALRALRQTLRRVASAASRVRVYPSRSAWPIAQ